MPDAEAVVKVTKKRVAQLKKTLQGIKSSEKLGSGDAAVLTGAFGFTLCATFGRFGRAKLRPYIRRCGEWRSGLNPQIRAANDFWLRFLDSFQTREVPVFVERRKTVVTYSDGEGADAGLGIALWSAECTSGPLAAYCQIPDSIRKI